MTAAEGATLLERGAARRNAMQVARSWQLRVPGAWEPYAKDLEGAMAPAYRCSRAHAVMHCSRSMPGDVLRFRVDGESASGGLIVHAELQGSPD